LNVNAVASNTMPQKTTAVRSPSPLRSDLRDGDGEDGIAERHQPRGVAVHGRRVHPRLASKRSRHRPQLHPAHHEEPILRVTPWRAPR
jgi:hypothetical protein